MRRIIISQLIALSLLLLVYYSLSEGPEHYPSTEEILSDEYIGKEVAFSALPVKEIVNNSYISFTTDFNQTLLIPLPQSLGKYNDKVSAKGLLQKQGDVFILEPSEIFLHNKFHRVYIRFPMSFFAFLLIAYFFLKEFRFNSKKLWWSDK